MNVEMGSTPLFIDDPFLNDTFTSKVSSKRYLEAQLESVEVYFPMQRHPSSMWNLIDSYWPQIYNDDLLFEISQQGLNKIELIESILIQSSNILPDCFSCQRLRLQSIMYPENIDKLAKK
jgi:hypothetical protein